MDPQELTPMVLDPVKNKIIHMLVRMFLLPSLMIQPIDVRRGKRTMITEDDTEVLHVPLWKWSPVTEVDVSDDDDDSAYTSNTMLQLFNLGLLKELWRKLRLLQK